MKAIEVDASEARRRLADLPGWQLGADETSIESLFEFRSFSEAFGFMTRAALSAEKLDHHGAMSTDGSRCA